MNVLKIHFKNEITHAEVQFYLLAEHMDDDSQSEELESLALVLLYSPSNEQILRELFGTISASRYNGVDKLIVIPTLAILSVVSMQPLPPTSFSWRTESLVCYQDLDHDGVLSAEGLGVNHMEGEYGATS
jgi:hypothetical protein